jgi:hypothetical protein
VRTELIKCKASGDAIESALALLEHGSTDEAKAGAGVPAALFWQLHISPSHALLNSFSGGGLGGLAGIFGGGGGGAGQGVAKGGAGVGPRLTFSPCVAKELVVAGGPALDALVADFVDSLAGDAVMIG